MAAQLFWEMFAVSVDFLNKCCCFSTQTAPYREASDLSRRVSSQACGPMSVLSCLFVLNLVCPAAGGRLDTVDASGRDSRMTKYLSYQNVVVDKCWLPGHPEVTEFCTVVPNVCRSAVRNLMRVTLLVHGILRLLLDFWKLCTPHALMLLFLQVVRTKEVYELHKASTPETFT
jgi:hypothetical protein